MKITEQTKVTETLKMSKDILKVYKKYGLDCPGCKGAGEDSVKIAALNNGLDVKKFLADLNGALK